MKSISPIPPAHFHKELLRTLTAIKNGNFSVRISPKKDGLEGKIANTLNKMIRNLRETSQKNTEQNKQSQALMEDLKKQQEELKKMSEYKSEFLANFSHELRTPLNSLLILSKLLYENSENNLTKKQIEFAKTIYHSGNDILTQINDILDISKIAASKAEININEVICSDLKDHIERNFRQFAIQKLLRFSVELDDTFPSMIQTDSKRLQQVLKNLLSNAFKFTEKGNVTLRMRIAKEGWSSNHKTLQQANKVLAFSVTDTGIGISKDKQEIIFEAFQQEERETSRKYGGTGLGLSISREMAQLLGGEIILVSAPGLGSTFTLYLPHNPKTSFIRFPVKKTIPVMENINEPRNEIIQRVNRAACILANKKVLIVDDDFRNIYVVSTVLERYKMNVLYAENGKNGIALLKENPDINLVLMDIMMTGMDGYQTIQAIRKIEKFKDLPIIALTAKAMKEDRQKCIEAGASDHVAKPLEPNQLLTLIRAWMN